MIRSKVGVTTEEELSEEVCVSCAVFFYRVMLAVATIA